MSNHANVYFNESNDSIEKRDFAAFGLSAYPNAPSERLRRCFLLGTVIYLFF